MPKSRFYKFDVYWWVSSHGRELCRYATRKPTDIECFSLTHYRIHVYSIDGSGETLEIILKAANGSWSAKCDCFDEPTEFYPFAYSESDWESLWTDATGDELMVIQGRLPTE
jgi:hypothetical protein